MTPNCQANQNAGISITAIQPTIYFVEGTDGLKQAVDISIDSPNAKSGCGLVFCCGTTKEKIGLDNIEAGQTTSRVYVRDIREKQQVSFQLVCDGEVASEKKVEWQPQRHWTVHLIHNAHFDPGYTDLPSNVMAEYLDSLDKALQYCRQTEDWPCETRFRYVVEQAWIAIHYLENRPPEVAEKFVHFCNTGQIEVNAFYANMISEILGYEETARLMYPAFELKRRYGIAIRTAEHNDIPGMSWSYATILAEAGIKYLVPAVPDYYTWHGHNYRWNYDLKKILPNDCPEAFYWQGQNGKKVLVYWTVWGAGGEFDYNLVDLPNKLEEMDKQNYKYDVVRYFINGGRRDNAPPIMDFAATAKKWNEKWAFPRYVTSTNYNFFTALEKQLPADVPVHRGDYTGTDYPIGAISTTEETGVSRLATDSLAACERLATIASRVAGFDYPSDMLKEAYLELLRHDEHVWGNWCAMSWAMEADLKEKKVYSHRSLALAEDVYVKSINRIADHVKIENDCAHLVVFNPLEYTRDDMVDVSFTGLSPCGLVMYKPDDDPNDPHAQHWVNCMVIGRHLNSLPEEVLEKGLTLIDLQTGESVPCQLNKISDYKTPVPFAAERMFRSQVHPACAYNLFFSAKNVPAMGYKTYKVVIGEDKAETSGVAVDGNTIENEYYKVVVDQKNGGVCSIYDKELKKELVDPKADYHVNQFFSKTILDSKVELTAKPTIRAEKTGPFAVSLIIDGSMPGLP